MEGIKMVGQGQPSLDPRHQPVNSWQGSWSRWPQDQSMIGSSTPQMHDPRDAPSDTRHKALLAAPFIMAPSYNNPAPVHYQQQYYPYGPYTVSPPAHMSAGYRPEYHERLPYPDTSPYDQRAYYHAAERREKMSFEEMAHSPTTTSSDSGVPMSGQSTGTSAPSRSKVIIKNETINPQDEVVFNTPIDCFMRMVQSTKMKNIHGTSSPTSPTGSFVKVEETSDSGKTTPKKRKPYVCDGPNCGKRFPQKARLEVHRRSHTGEKPHGCTWVGCDFRSTQPGNLTAHFRTHTKEKPYACKIEGCTKAFARKNGLTSHISTHRKEKPHICKLDNCNKPFTTNGNLKSHQNNLHVSTLERLMKRIELGEAIPPEDVEIMEHLAVVHHNANKGIRGRGKSKKPNANTHTNMDMAPTARSSSRSPSSCMTSSSSSIASSTPPQTPNSTHYGHGVSPMITISEGTQSFHGNEYGLYSHSPYDHPAHAGYDAHKRHAIPRM